MTPITSRCQNLTMHYRTRKGDVSAVDDVSFHLRQGKSLGLVGESGCGKTSIAFSLMRLLPDNAKIMGGQHLIERHGHLLALTEDEMRQAPLEPHLDGLPGGDERPEPGLHGGRPDHRGPRPALAR